MSSGVDGRKNSKEEWEQMNAKHLSVALELCL